MKKPSSSTIVLAATFLVLLAAYLSFRIIQYQSAQRERRQIEQQPSVHAQSIKRAAQMQAILDASEKSRSEVDQKDQELIKAGVHGEQRKRELAKTIKESEQEMSQTLKRIRQQKD